MTLTGFMKQLLIGILWITDGVLIGIGKLEFTSRGFIFFIVGCIFGCIAAELTTYWFKEK
jgi:hypothetical protein